MKQSHYEFPPSTMDDGHDQFLLFDIHRVDNTTGRTTSVVLTRGQTRQIRERRRIRAQTEWQASSPEAQPSVLRRAGHAAVQSAHPVVGRYPSI